MFSLVPEQQNKLCVANKIYTEAYNMIIKHNN